MLKLEIILDETGNFEILGLKDVAQKQKAVYMLELAKCVILAQTLSPLLGDKEQTH